MKIRTAKQILGALKLPDKDAEKYRQALHYYGLEPSPAFLRHCANTLIVHHKNKDPLNTPLSFQLGRRREESP
jgi:hypothetical protein